LVNLHPYMNTWEVATRDFLGVATRDFVGLPRTD
jgi:hypothetical protein